MHLLTYKGIYIIDEVFDASRTIGLWKKLLDEAMAKGFKSLRIVGEMNPFFEKGLVMEMAGYEKSLQRSLTMPITAICVYDSGLVSTEASLLIDLIKAHGHGVFPGIALNLTRSV